MQAGPAFIAHGVTGVRDMASPLEEILTLRDRWRTASPSGPRLVLAGPIVQGRSVWDAQASGMTTQDRQAADRVWDRYREMVRLMRDAGVSILAGSDLERHGDSLHRELELLVEAGLSPAEAIASATGEATAFLGLIDDVGTVEAGKRADLVLLDADPLADIRNTRRIADVMAGGVLLNRTELRALVTDRPVIPLSLWIVALCAAAFLVRTVISRRSRVL